MPVSFTMGGEQDGKLEKVIRFMGVPGTRFLGGTGGTGSGNGSGAGGEIGQEHRREIGREHPEFSGHSELTDFAFFFSPCFMLLLKNKKDTCRCTNVKCFLLLGEKNQTF